MAPVLAGAGDPERDIREAKRTDDSKEMRRTVNSLKRRPLSPLLGLSFTGHVSGSEGRSCA